MKPTLKRAMMARRRRSDGTFMEGGYTEPWMRSGSFGVNPDGTNYPVYPSMRRDRMGRFTSEGGERRMDRRSNPIGFAPPEFSPERYGSRVGMTNMDESKRWNSDYSMGYAKSDMDEPMSKETAHAWVMGMKNADGTTGAHWTMEQAAQIMEQNKIRCDEVEFFATLNMIYSDYCKVAKKFNCSTVEFYAAMAKAFLDDKDAQPDKLERYYTYIAEH